MPDITVRARLPLLRKVPTSMSVELEVHPELNASAGRLRDVPQEIGGLGKTAAELWDEMNALDAPGAMTAEHIDSRGLAATRRLVDDAIFAVGPSGRRRVPSAGAIFPYAILSLCRYQTLTDSVAVQPPAWGLFRLEASASLVTRVPVEAAAAAALAAAIPQATASDQAYILTLTRPWLSVRKYGPRGYLYAQVDAAHAAVNLLGMALQSGRAELHVDPSDPVAREILGSHLPFHELHSVLVLREGADSSGPSQFDVEVGSAGARKTAAFNFEAQAWSGLVDPLEANAVGTPAASEGPIITTKHVDPSRERLIHDWPELSRRRKSAKAFGTQMLSFKAIEGVLESVGIPLPTNLPSDDEGNVEMTAVISHSADLSNAEEESLAQRFNVRRMSDPGHVAGVVRACMGQKHVAHAQVFLVLHSRRSDVVPNVEAHRIRRVLFRAGAAAQLAYLGAARYGIGVFTVGGFDARAWKKFAHIGADDEVLCLLALGADAAEHSPRADREEKASAHGE